MPQTGSNESGSQSYSGDGGIGGLENKESNDSGEIESGGAMG